MFYQCSWHCDSRYVGHTCKFCRTELNNTSPNLSVLALPPRNAYFLPIGVNLPPRAIPSLLLLERVQKPLDFIFYKILSVLSIMMTVDSLFWPKAALLSIYLLSMLLSSKLLTPPSADKKEFLHSLKDSALMTLCHWSFSIQSRFVFFPIIDASFPALSNLAILLDKCRTKNFENEHSNSSNKSRQGGRKGKGVVFPTTLFA